MVDSNNLESGKQTEHMEQMGTIERSPQIMIVDAEPQVAFEIGEVLTSYNYIPLIFNSALKALEYLGNRTNPLPDLIICDLMGDSGLGDGIDGLEFLRQVRKMPIEKLPVMIATSLESNSTFEKAIIDLGADDFLIKPVRFSELLLRVRVLLRGLPGVAAWRGPELL